MGMRMPETCWAVFKRQVINLRSCCILLVDSVESMMIHGFTHPKCKLQFSGVFLLLIYTVFGVNISKPNLSAFTFNTKRRCLYKINIPNTWPNLWCQTFNPLNPELNPICYLLALLAHHFLHVSRIRVKLLTFRRLMSYTYGAPILDVSRSHTTTQHSR